MLKRRLKKHKKHNIGAPPGELYYSGDVTGDVKITLIQYNESEYFEADFFDVKAMHK